MTRPAAADVHVTYSVDQLEAGIANALAAGDPEAAIDILRALLVVDVRRGLAAYHAIELGISLRRIGNTS